MKVSLERKPSKRIRTVMMGGTGLVGTTGKGSKMKIIKSDKIPEPKGHYSPAIEHNGVLYLSGQLPIDPVTGKVPGTIEDQTQQALQNVQRILTEAGSSMAEVLSMRLYIPDVALWSAVNEVYATFLGAHRPARAIIPTRELHHGCLIEIEAVAVCE